MAEQGPRWRERLAGLGVPTLVLHGDRDPLFPLGNATALAEEIPHARLVVLPGVGHELPRRVWPQVVEHVAAGAGDPH
jgi:pimeloyl-ACP methyl ester carboxylesterase